MQQIVGGVGLPVSGYWSPTATAQTCQRLQLRKPNNSHSYLANSGVDGRGEVRRPHGKMYLGRWHLLFFTGRLYLYDPCHQGRGPGYSTVTDLARLRGLSTSVPRAHAVW
jgi:hypothetical protein